MERQSIPFEGFNTNFVQLFDKQWLLLASGDLSTRQFNAMTISWGSLGYMWGRPFVQVMVRPQRYTFEFMEHYPTFSVCAFPPEYRQALSLLGTRSGREGDKLGTAGLTPIAASCIQAPIFEEAELVIECRKIYWQDIDPNNFLNPDIAKNYPIQDYHRLYYGEILALEGIGKFRA
jgi:flavin reductase (DIM6/NTAB) family NADH-FMN oxidoreductase RutF